MHYIHHDKFFFTNYHKLKHRLYVEGIESEFLAIEIGNMSIMNKTGHVRILENVLHAPKRKNDLMSLTQLAIKE